MTDINTTDGNLDKNGCVYHSGFFKFKRELFHLWCFLASEGLCEDAREYLSEHMHQPSPLDPCFFESTSVKSDEA